jgi:hypothetical protein
MYVTLFSIPQNLIHLRSQDTLIMFVSIMVPLSVPEVSDEFQ